MECPEATEHPSARHAASLFSVFRIEIVGLKHEWLCNMFKPAVMHVTMDHGHLLGIASSYEHNTVVLVSLDRPFLFHSTDRFQYTACVPILKVISAVEQKGSGLQDYSCIGKVIKCCRQYKRGMRLLQPSEGIKTKWFCNQSKPESTIT